MALVAHMPEIVCGPWGTECVGEWQYSNWLSAQAIFSYHGKRQLWQHICLKVYVIPGELSVWVNGNFRIGQKGSSSA